MAHSPVEEAIPQRFVPTPEQVAGETLVFETEESDRLRAIKSPDEELEIRRTATMQNRVFERFWR